jgi:type I restriction enzyme S subunit
MMRIYDSYKDSGIEWIGEIPRHWNTSKFKYSSSLFTGNSLNDDQKTMYESNNIKDIPYVSSKDINVELRTVNFDNGLRIPKNEKGFKVSPKGSFLMVIEGGSSGRKIVYLDRDVCFVNKLCSFLSYHNTKYQYYFVQSQNYQDKFRLSISGLIGGVSISNLRDFELLLPPLSEQEQIVSYLDEKTLLIDEMVEKKKRKIELLKEYRTSLINTVVTKGLNPDVPMKDSGIEWIGEIPRHWECKLLKYVFKSVREKSENGDEELLSVMIRRGVVKRTEYLEDDIEHITRSESLKGYIKCSKWNLVNNIMKMGFYCMGISLYDGIVSPGYSVFELIDKKNHPLYWEYLLKTEIYVTEYRKRSKGIQESRMRLYDDYFLSIHSIIPPPSEQEQIVSYLDEKTSEIDKTIELEKKKIELLKEYRQSLISNVVTGKIKVVSE